MDFTARAERCGDSLSTKTLGFFFGATLVATAKLGLLILSRCEAFAAEFDIRTASKAAAAATCVAFAAAEEALREISFA